MGNQVHGLIELRQWEAMRDDGRGVKQARL
jgi:hypothetical protein